MTNFTMDMFRKMVLSPNSYNTHTLLLYKLLLTQYIILRVTNVTTTIFFHIKYNLKELIPCEICIEDIQQRNMKIHFQFTNEYHFIQMTIITYHELMILHHKVGI